MARRGNRRSKGIGPIGGIITLTVLVIGGVALVATGNRGGALAGVSSDISGAAGSIVSVPVRWGQQGWSSVSSFFGGSKLNGELKAQNENLLQWRDQARAMSERLDAYEKLLGMTKEQLPQGLAGRLIGESNSTFSRAGIVNLGSKDGVRVNWIVMNQNGLVGRVIAVGSNTSRVLLLGDGDSRVPVMGEVTRARAIASGDKSNAPRLAHLNTPTLMQDGERVMTSGDDGIFPRGIAVGQAGIAPDRQWRLRLATVASPIDFVRLVPPSNFPPPLDPVTPPPLDAPPVGASNSIVGPALPTGNVMPLAPGATPIPTAATPEAIRAAQTDQVRKAAQQAEDAQKLAKKLILERDVAREAARKAEAARILAEQRAALTRRGTQVADPRSRRGEAQVPPVDARTDTGRPQRPLRPTKKLDPTAVPVAPSALKGAGQGGNTSPPAIPEGPQ
jgi:rod shape-determining protein MreC